MVTYDPGFKSFPRSVFSCVNDSKEVSLPNNQNCADCEPNELNKTNGCSLISFDGFGTTYCSTAENGNVPQITSCHVGVFSITPNLNTAQIKTCPKNTTYCKVINSNIKLDLKQEKNVFNFFS